jgi:hypothetical protein
MIPAADDHGLLPKGVWDCTLGEIESVFAWNLHRQGLVMGLRRFLAEQWAPLGIACPIYVDGSFVRGKSAPSDVDIVLDLTDVSGVAPIAAAMAIRLQHDAIKATYTVDVWVRHPDLPRDLAAFFQYLGTKGAADLRLDSKHPKGILRLP